jgi:protein tyrosine phosphatase (PTP) superfamily phosphohydrolase (DUF442 family)
MTRVRLRTFLLAGSALALALCAYLAFGGLKDLRDRTWPKRWGVVEEGVYRSGQLHHALVHATLRGHGIRTIVDLTRENTGDPHEAAEAAAIKDLGIALERYPMNGNGTGHVDRIAGAVAAVERSRARGEPVLVHCNSGAQRTTSIVAIHQVLVRGKSPAAVVAELRRFGWDPIEHGVLLEFLNANMAQLASRLVELGVLREMPRKLPRLAAVARLDGFRHDDRGPLG